MRKRRHRGTALAHRRRRSLVSSVGWSARCSPCAASVCGAEATFPGAKGARTRAARQPCRRDQRAKEKRASPIARVRWGDCRARARRALPRKLNHVPPTRSRRQTGQCHARRGESLSDHSTLHVCTHTYSKVGQRSLRTRKSRVRLWKSSFCSANERGASASPSSD